MTVRVDDVITVEVAALTRFSRSVLIAAGLPVDQAEIVSDALVNSELRNHAAQGQGVARLTRYCDRILSRQMNPDAKFEILKESPALALADAGNGAGSVVAINGMSLAVSKAKTCGIGIVVVRHSTHLGSAGYPSLHAAEQGCIGVTLTNAGPEMAPWGGMDPVLGTNPWAVAVPTSDSTNEMPIVLDMALTTSGKGMIRQSVRIGEPVPGNWALSQAGLTTTDPASAVEGTLLPIGDFKGYGLSLITDVLTGVVSGGAFGTIPYSDPCFLNVSHQFIAYDIDWFMPRREFYEKLSSFMAMIKASRTRPGHDEILLPGEPEWRRMQFKLRAGIPLESGLLQELHQLADNLGVSMRLG